MPGCPLISIAPPSRLRWSRSPGSAPAKSSASALLVAVREEARSVAMLDEAIAWAVTGGGGCHQRLELETDLIAACLLATRGPPPAQFIG